MGASTMTERRVLAIGVFDLFHIGHLRYLATARQQGTHLTVAVSSDTIVCNVKQKHTTIPEADRLEIVRAVRYVDEANLLPCTTDSTAEAAEWIEQWGIQHVVVGSEWEGSARWDRLTPALAKRNITVAFAPKTEGVSTTQMVLAIRGGWVRLTASQKNRIEGKLDTPSLKNLWSPKFSTVILDAP